jgi:hypothetical protein
MKKTILIGILLLVLTACSTSVPKVTDTNVEVTTNDAETNLEIADNTATAQIGESSWCSVGTTIKSNTVDANANLEVIGIETSGQYAGYCHSNYKINSNGYDLNMDYYLNQEGNGYVVTNMNGQISTTEYHSN